MKSDKLTKGDLLLITQEFINDNKIHNATFRIWKLNSAALVEDNNDYGVIVKQGHYTCATSTRIAESMRQAFVDNERLKSDH